jgi:hypothetical protein
MEMARVAIRRCDVCGKETDLIVGKLLYVPSIPGVTKLTHSQYTHHADIGTCCKNQLFKVFKFQTRMSAREYAAKRRNGSKASYTR